MKEPIDPADIKVGDLVRVEWDEEGPEAREGRVISATAGGVGFPTTWWSKGPHCGRDQKWFLLDRPEPEPEPLPDGGHAAEAEKLLARTKAYPLGDLKKALLAEAQVHATLAVYYKAVSS